MKNLFKIVFTLLLLMIFLACSNVNTEAQKKQLQGYWVVDKVIMPDGSERKLPPANSVEFFEVTGDSGVRQKLMPKLDGTYKKFVGGEKFYLVVQNDSLYVQYITPYATWIENVVEANENQLILKNKGNRSYFYIRHESINIIE